MLGGAIVALQNLGCAHALAALGPGAMPAAPVVASGPILAAKEEPGLRCFLWMNVVDRRAVSPRGGDECDVRSTPASTFKIPNALIALEANVIDEHTVLPWDGQSTWNPQWNRDQDLSSAITNSVVWYFQRVAESVGRERYQTYLPAFRYGNAEPGPVLTQFWLDDSLRISPREQAAFLSALYAGELPVRAAAADAVKEILELRGPRIVDLRDRLPFVDRIPAGTVLSGKTGTSVRPRAEGGSVAVGWFVGAVEHPGDGRPPIVFAARIRSDDAAIGGAAAARFAFDELERARLL
jgi:beta-lactamase class D